MSSPSLNHSARLASLQATRLLDSPQEEEFDRVTRLAAATLRAPVCLVSLVDDNRQFFKSATGLPSPWCEQRETPLSHSFCQLAVETRTLLRIEDATIDPRVQGNLAVSDIGVIAYLGFPLMGEDGHVWGSFCVIDVRPRKWTPEDEENVQTFAAITARLIDQRRSLGRMRNLIEVLAHDLKNPLAGVRMISGLLQDRIETLPAFCHGLINGLEGDSQRALDLIASVVGRSSLSDDHAGNPAAMVRIADVFAEMSERFHGSLEAKSIGLVPTIEPPDAAFRVDEWALHHILDNLISNAIKFSEPGTTIGLHAEAEVNQVIIEVRDQGPGFSREDLKNLYGRYSRLSARPTQGEDSTGLGLSLVKRLADQCKAVIECQSVEGSGTVFRLAFPTV